MIRRIAVRAKDRRWLDILVETKPSIRTQAPAPVIKAEPPPSTPPSGPAFAADTSRKRSPRDVGDPDVNRRRRPNQSTVNA